ncbi:RTA1 like protein-domain-containing protein [Truncatella angustata]|uniref:RTA1 like protein-domain-containing protein n=1 Tax=Truncatella angustata TaxID=152316 RepID=A0A9P8UPI4_9PEZI|nr:RTA1 like protein-domain-containing protein [Truncatella angustata]KAH6655873.1 RTA1 like protein-domain-containing protein [Truncatella angustata]
MAGYLYYHYNPSVAGAVIFAVLFTVASGRHLQQIIQSRSWFFIPFLIGCLVEAGGYVARLLSAKQTPNWTLMPYILQSIMTLLGPTFFAASIYMVLGRLIRLLEADRYSLIRTRWLTKFFLLGDILSFFGQGGGGGMLATAKTPSSQSLGNNVILLGLAIQVLFFGFFMVVTLVFHVRLMRRPTQKSMAISAPWHRFIWVLYGTSLFIMIRSVFRMAEYAQGNDGSLLQTEIYIYVLDALLMVFVAIIFAIYHPSEVLNAVVVYHQNSFPGENDAYPMVKGNGFHQT